MKHEEKSEAVEILKDVLFGLANAYIEQLKMIEEYNKLKAKQRKERRKRYSKKNIDRDKEAVK